MTIELATLDSKPTGLKYSITMGSRVLKIVNLMFLMKILFTLTKILSLKKIYQRKMK